MFRNIFLFLSIALAAGLGKAQVAPTAGVLLQQLEQGRVSALPNKSSLNLLPLPQPLKQIEGLLVTVTSFRFSGNSLLNNAELAASVSSFLNRPLNFTELQGAVTAVTQAYRQAGWVTRTYLPQQEIKNGVVTIEIVEAVFGVVRTEVRPASRIALSRLTPIITNAQSAGASLSVDKLDRALLLLDDLPGLAVSGSLVQGEHERETDLLLKIDNKPIFNGDIGVDNTGTPSTGKQHYNLDSTLNSPFGLGELVSANLMHSDGSDYVRLAASLPLGFDGWRVGANASYLAYRLITPEFASLHAQGNSVTAGLEATYPLLRSRLKNLYFAANIDNKHFDNAANAVTTSSYQVNTLTAGLNGNLFDGIGAGGANAVMLALVQGRANLHGSPNAPQDAGSVQTAGSFTKLKYALSRQQTINADLAFFAALAGQIADKNLDSSEKFYLGGPGAVRAYPGGEGGGSDGQLLNLELRARLPHHFSSTAFYDWGHVTVNHDNAFEGSASTNRYSLKGAGLSLGWQGESSLSLKASWARRIGANPNPGVAGMDSDGTLVRDRFWLQAIYSY